MQLPKPEELSTWNQTFRSLSPEKIAAKMIAPAKRPIVTTNFRPYEASILYVCTKVRKEIPVIWCDTGYNTGHTYRHANQLIKLLNLSVQMYVPRQSTGYRNIIMDGIPELEDSRHAEFTEQVKLEPFRRAMQEHMPDVWFTNLRKGQTALRDSLDIITLTSDGIYKVSPFYHYSDEDLDRYLKDHNLPNEHRYFDSTKVLGNRECGIHAVQNSTS